MKQHIYSVIGFDVPTLIYESVEEADKAAGRVGAALEECNNNLAYRGSHPTARGLIADIVNELTKVPWKMRDTGEKDDTGKPIMEVDENEAPYVKRALEMTPSVTREAVQALINKRAAGYTAIDPETKQPVKFDPIAVDIKQRERQPQKPKVLPARYKEAALGILKANNVPKFNKASAKYGIEPFTPTNNQENDSVALGWICKRYADAKAEEARNEFAVK